MDTPLPSFFSTHFQTTHNHPSSTQTTPFSPQSSLFRPTIPPSPKISIPPTAMLHAPFDSPCPPHSTSKPNQGLKIPPSRVIRKNSLSLHTRALHPSKHFAFAAPRSPTPPTRFPHPSLSLQVLSSFTPLLPAKIAFSHRSNTFSLKPWLHLPSEHPNPNTHFNSPSSVSSKSTPFHSIPLLIHSPLRSTRKSAVSIPSGRDVIHRMASGNWWKLHRECVQPFLRPTHVLWTQNRRVGRLDPILRKVPWEGVKMTLGGGCPGGQKSSISPSPGGLATRSDRRSIEDLISRTQRAAPLEDGSALWWRGGSTSSTSAVHQGASTAEKRLALASLAGRFSRLQPPLGLLSAILLPPFPLFPSSLLLSFFLSSFPFSLLSLFFPFSSLLSLLLLSLLLSSFLSLFLLLSLLSSSSLSTLSTTIHSIKASKNTSHLSYNLFGITSG